MILKYINTALLTKKWPQYSTCTMNTIQEPLDSPGKTRQDLLIRNYIWTSVWVTVCTVMRGKSWSRIGLLIFSLLTFCSRIILWAGCWPGHCRCLAASLQHDQISHLAKAFLRTAGPEFENRKQTERVPKKSPLPYSDYNVQIANFHEPISAMRMEFGIVSAPRMEFCYSFCLLVSSVSDFRPDTKRVVVDIYLFIYF